MRRILITAALLLAGSACSATGASVESSGANGQRSFAVGAFDEVELAGPYDVRVNVGGGPAVRAEGDEEALRQMEVRVDGGRLVIGTKPGTWRSRGNATVFVDVPALRAATLAGSGDIEVSPLRAPQFAGSVAGSGNLVLQQLESDAATFEIAGSGNIRASGRAREARLEIAGTGNGELRGLQSETADVSIMGSGNVEVNATGAAKVSIMGSGDVAVTGGARCEVSKMGSGAVRCG